MTTTDDEEETNDEEKVTIAVMCLYLAQYNVVLQDICIIR